MSHDLPRSAERDAQIANSGSVFANAHVAGAACALLQPLLAQCLQSEALVPSHCLHVVVMDPARSPQDCSFDEAILWEMSLPERTRWDADYAAYARAKARVAWRTGVDGTRLHTCEPYRLMSEDTNLRGAVVHHGIVVAVSGALPWFDEAIATCVATWLRALALQRAHGTEGVLALSPSAV